MDALNEVIKLHGTPEIFNTDQGSQFTSEEFTDVLKAHDNRISRDGKGCRVDNVFVERLWRSVKYEEVYLKAYDSMSDARASLGIYFDFYNTERRHQSLGRRTPDRVYYGGIDRRVAWVLGALNRCVQLLGFITRTRCSV